LFLSIFHNLTENIYSKTQQIYTTFGVVVRFCTTFFDNLLKIANSERGQGAVFLGALEALGALGVR